MLGEDEVAAGKAKIKENGLREGHPEKDGVLVDLDQLVPELKRRLEHKAKMDSNIKVASGLRVVSGIRGEPEKALPAAVTQEEVREAASEVVKDEASGEVVVTEDKKPENNSLQSAEVIGTAPAS